MAARIRSRAGAALAVERALKRIGFQPVIRSDEDEPVVSIEIDEGRWVDVFVREAVTDGELIF